MICACVMKDGERKTRTRRDRMRGRNGYCDPDPCLALDGKDRPSSSRQEADHALDGVVVVGRATHWSEKNDDSIRRIRSSRDREAVSSCARGELD